MPLFKKTTPPPKQYNVTDLMSFIKKLWLYTSVEARCFAIVAISSSSNPSIEFKHFCLDDLKNYDNIYNNIYSYVEKNIERWVNKRYNVYYQVLPLAQRPEQGRGSAKDVKVGAWVFADLDFKENVNKKDFEGCREGSDHELECYYEEGGKVIHIKRPPLTQVLEDVRSRLDEPTLVVDSGAGYHIYFKLKYEVDSQVISSILWYVVEKLGGDPQSKDLARILRLPGSVNPRVGRLCRVIYESLNELDPEELSRKIEAEKEKNYSTAVTTQKLRELNDSEILKIVELLKDAYKPGYRQSLVLFLSGWMAKANISPLSAVRIVKHLYDSTQDQDPLRTRLSAVVYSYKKAGVDVDAFASEIEQIAGSKPYGLEKEISEEEVKGRSGLQEIFEDVIGEERALAVIHELSEILQTLSPYKDSVIELVDYEKQLYAVANLRKHVLARAVLKDGLKYKERVAVVAPTKVVVYSNPLGGITKYEITFEGATLKKQLIVGPALLEEIADRLRAEGLVYHSKLVYDVLSAVVQGFIRKNRAEVKVEIESPGFYLINNRINTVKYEIRVDREKLKQALLLLNELAEIWFKHCQDKFATVVKWGAIAPFSYIMKQRGKIQRWLYLYGDSATGKTTLGRIVLKMWNLDSRFYEKTGASVDTPARWGYVVSMSTFPVLINEPGGALIKEDIVEMIKSSVDSLIARGRYVKGAYIEYPALAPMVFTSNKFLPKDDALLRRFIIISFSFGEKIPKEKQDEFKQKVEPRLGILSEIGACISNIVADKIELLDSSEELLMKCYEVVGLPKPAWLDLNYEEDEVEDITNEFVERFKKFVNDLFARYISKIIEVDRESMRVLKSEQIELPHKLEILIKKNMIPGISLKDDLTIIKRQLLEELNMSNISLKSLAERMGWEYKKVSEMVNKQKINYVAIIVPLDQIKSLFS